METMLDASMPLAEAHGYTNVSRDMVARVAGISPSLLSQYWTAPQFQQALIERAIATRNLAVLAQGLATRHPSALAAPYGLRHAAANFLIGG